MKRTAEEIKSIILAEAQKRDSYMKTYVSTNRKKIRAYRAKFAKEQRLNATPFTLFGYIHKGTLLVEFNGVRVGKGGDPRKWKTQTCPVCKKEFDVLKTQRKTYCSGVCYYSLFPTNTL